MALTTVSVGQPVLASTTNALINHVNAANGAVKFTSSGAWQVPQGVTRFRVTLCAGGDFSNEFYTVADSPMVSKYFVDQVEGTTYNITVGIGANFSDGLIYATPTIFGIDALYSYPNGSHNGDMLHGNMIHLQSPGIAHGRSGNSSSGISGGNGVCVIEW